MPATVEHVPGSSFLGRLAMTAYARGWWRVSEVLFARLRRTGRLTPEMYAAASRILLARGRVLEDIAMLEPLLGQAEQPLPVLLEYAVALYTQHQDDRSPILQKKALAACRQAMQAATREGTREDQDTAQFCLAGTLLDVNPAEAEALDRDLLERNPGVFEYIYAIGLIHARRADWPETIRTMEAALAIRADAGDAHYELANALCFVKKWNRADEHFASSLRCGTHHAKQALYGRALCRFELGDRSAARRYVSESLAMDEHYELALLLKGDLDGPSAAVCDGDRR